MTVVQPVLGVIQMLWKTYVVNERYPADLLFFLCKNSLTGWSTLVLD